eukprot:6201141-Pleurochrysis_carterae.AAC.2
MGVQVLRRRKTATICRVFQNVVAVRRMCRAEHETGAADDLVGAVELAAVRAGHRGEARWMLSGPERRRAAVCGRGRREVSGHGEGGARR